MLRPFKCMDRGIGWRKWVTPDGIVIRANTRYGPLVKRIVVDWEIDDFEYKKMIKILLEKEDYKQIYDNEMR